MKTLVILSFLMLFWTLVIVNVHASDDEQQLECSPTVTLTQTPTEEPTVTEAIPISTNNTSLPAEVSQASAGSSANLQIPSFPPDTGHGL